MDSSWGHQARLIQNSDHHIYLPDVSHKVRNIRGHKRLVPIHFRGADELFSRVAWTLELRPILSQSIGPIKMELSGEVILSR